MPEVLSALVRDGFRILKVGPGVTFALREALYALADIETQLVGARKRSNLRDVVERVMLSKPGYWEKYYYGDAEQQRVLRTYSYSDRVCYRYYWADAKIDAAAQTLLDNLSALKIPENLPQPVPCPSSIGRYDADNRKTSRSRWCKIACGRSFERYAAACHT